MSNLVQLGPQYFPMSSIGTPVGAGNLYIGNPDTDPTIIGNQKLVNSLQEDGSFVAMSQPITLSAGGVPLYDGSPVVLYTSGDYSMTVLDINGAQIYYVPSTPGVPIVPGNYYYPDATELDHGVAGNGSTVNTYIDDIGTTNKATIYFRHDSGNEYTDYTFLTSEAGTDNIFFEFEVGARIKPAAGITLTVYSPEQIIASSGQQIVNITNNSTNPLIFTIGGIISAHWFGTDPSTAVNNSGAIQAAANSLKQGTIGFYRRGIYEMASTVEITVGISIDGHAGNLSYSGNDDDAVIFASQVGGIYYDYDGSTSTKDFLFFLNVATAAPTTWIESFPNIGSGIIRNVRIDGTNTSGIKGFYFAGSYEFENISCEQVSTLIRKPNIYTDYVRIEGIHASLRSNDTDYLIHLTGLGDSYKISRIGTGYTGIGVGITRGLYIEQCRGGDIFGLINGIHHFFSSQGITVHGAHIEGGHIEIDSAEVTLRGNVFFTTPPSEEAVQLLGTSVAANNRYDVTIEDNLFVKTAKTAFLWDTVEKVDVLFTSTGISATLTNNRRVLTVSGAITNRAAMGILVGSGAGGAGVEYADWTAYSHVLSLQKTVVSNSKVVVTANGENLIKTLGGFSSVVTTPDVVWQGATDTYYYQAMLLTDPIRLLGLTTAGAEVNQAVVNGDDGVQLVIDLATIERNGGYIIRVFRGTATGSYDFYVDIPCVMINRFLDNFDALNGFVWTARGAAGVDTLNSNNMPGRMMLIDGIITLYSSASSNPTVGTWKEGDRIIETNYVIDGNQMLLSERRRLTDGAGHVANTDWAALNMSTVSPAT